MNAAMGRPYLLLRRREGDTLGIYGDISVVMGDGKHKRICGSIERPDLNNKRSVSCIPIGDYDLFHRTSGRYFGKYSQRWGHKFVMQVDDVPNRTGILIHAGRGIVDSKGCIITTDERKVNKQGRLTSAGTSREAYCRLYKAVARHKIYEIVIRDE